MFIKRTVPLAVAISFGIITLMALVIPIPALVNIITGWVGLLTAIALLLGILNLLAVHFNRLFRQRNIYSGVLVLSMVFVFVVAAADSLTGNGQNTGIHTIFTWVQAPLEAALGALMAVFLLTTGFQLIKQQPTRWSWLFLISVLTTLLMGTLTYSSLLPAGLKSALEQVRFWLNNVVLLSGMRGLLIGIALGTIVLSIRILAGTERPYQK
ncbi:MAG: hypothetical protein Kow0080_14440 [Candidatus Promineifilaceae bacterium]